LFASECSPRHLPGIPCVKLAVCAAVNPDLHLQAQDVDNFKAFKDQNGHCRADEVLREFGRLLKSCGKQAGDRAARYGGEEFAVILPNTNTKSASVVAERIQSSMLESRRPRADRDASALVRNADAALYQAKANGRNRCETFIAAWAPRLAPAWRFALQ
jgi:PleD family two-component response regulator